MHKMKTYISDVFFKCNYRITKTSMFNGAKAQQILVFVMNHILDWKDDGLIASF